MVITKNKPSSNIPEIFNNVSDEKLRETLILIKNSTNIKLNYNVKLTEPKEIENYFKEELESYLNEKYNEIHEKVSELREKGYDMMVWTFKLMSIPLKIKVFVATSDKKDFNTVTHKINEIGKAANEMFEKIKQREELYKQRKLAERAKIAKQQTLKKLK